MSFNGRYVNKDLIQKRVHQYYGFTVSEYDINDFIYDALRAISHNSIYVLKYTDGSEGNHDPIKIEEYKGLLPSDIEYPIVTRDYDSKLPMRCIKSMFRRDKIIGITQSNFTYQLNYKHIHTNKKSHKVELMYLGFPTDEYGNPLVPDHEEYLKPVTAYVANSAAVPMYMRDEISERKQSKIEQDWYAYANGTVSLEIPNEDEMDEIVNDWLTLLPAKNKNIPVTTKIIVEDNKPENLSW